MISICIPSYNYAHYLPYAIESCLAQREEFELVVLDNCSTDDTPGLRQKYVSDPRVRWFRNEKVLPRTQNFNHAVRLASQPYAMVLCADDALKPGSIGRFRQMIQSKPHVCFHGFLSEVIDDHGRVLRQGRPFSRTLPAVELTAAAALKGKLRQEVRFREPSCNFYRKTCWEAVGGYLTAYPNSEDMYFNIRMLQQFTAAMWNEHLVQIRRHQASEGALVAGQKFLDDLQHIIDEALKFLGEQATSTDRAAGRGWVMYRTLELAMQRCRRAPMASLKLLAGNVRLLASSPRAYYYCGRLLRSRLLYQDVQQEYRLPAET